MAKIEKRILSFGLVLALIFFLLKNAAYGKHAVGKILTVMVIAVA